MSQKIYILERTVDREPGQILGAYLDAKEAIEHARRIQIGMDDIEIHVATIGENPQGVCEYLPTINPREQTQC